MPISLPIGTLLVITPVYTGEEMLTPWSARGLTQTLEVITEAGGQGSKWLRRDVNGVLRDTSDVNFRKYRSTISCRDGETPCINNIWIGYQVLVDCVVELSFPAGGTPNRPAVSGSEITVGTINYYRPQLTMLITGIRNSFQEYAAINNWEINLEEV